ncbi:hypothetical protein [Fictibacillus fluitans]|uniref:Uncharacterized protein n=1 Tax=Fictibacillus fluitans TaxID=3058422 RepID=A0ABT8HZB7_9BACL|nr:hypothetical protein [Fictibacillus sp. NE201]MDN4526124.1 hypothetical protein [Fictibacillus sp. NE201]
MLFDKQKYKMQAEMLDWYSGKVSESMNQLDQVGRERAHVLSKAGSWESKSKNTYQQIMSEAASTHYSAAGTGEQLKEALKREANRLRQFVNELERKEKLDESQ